MFNIIFSYLPKRAREVFYYRYLWHTNFPEIVHIENTNACNGRCIMCPREKMTRQISFMDFSLFKKIIDECANHSICQEVHLHGFGECLLEKAFDKKISYAKGRGIKTTYIVTNASLLTEDIVQDLITSGLDKMKVSFYGATEGTYEKVHVNLKFNDVERNVLNLFKIREKLRKRNPSIFLQFLPLKENAHERELFSEKWSGIINKDNGDALLEYQLHNYGFGREYIPVDSAEDSIRGCALPFFTMQILWNGDVAPCCLDFNGDLILGNVKEHSLEDVWNFPSFAKLRKAHRTLDFKDADICGQCDQILVNRKTEL